MNSGHMQIYRGTHDETIELHWHEFYELSYVVSGSGTHHLNGHALPLTAGTIFLLTPADFHELTIDSGSLDIYNVIFSERYINGTTLQLLFHNMRQLQYTYPDSIRERTVWEYDRIRQELAEPRVGSEEMIRCTLERLLIDLYRGSEQVQLSRLQHTQMAQPNLQSALMYIHLHFRENITLEQAAKQAQYSANYFSGCFRDWVGMSFVSYVQQLRLQFAEALLQASNLPVTEIGFASGFNTLGHFERVFKEKYGVSPVKYRGLDKRKMK